MIALKASGLVVTGALQPVFDQRLDGNGPIRITVFNRGFTPLTAGVIEHLGDQPNTGPTPQPVSVDNATFATLAAQTAAQVVIPVPNERLRFRATCTAGSGTQLDVWVNTPERGA